MDAFHYDGLGVGNIRPSSIRVTNLTCVDLCLLLKDNRYHNHVHHVPLTVRASGSFSSSQDL